MFIEKDAIMDWLEADGVARKGNIYAMLPIYKYLLIEKTIANVLNILMSIRLFHEWLQHVDYRNAMNDATEE